ncbi:ABC transporter ATP-binding protein [Pontiella agarivorans]|uniref:ABC transporter ATP-binding protein n=1 Tax=Pontiella agarivorans TaxID=3038953 RepID=A0ABU5MZQ5_9BACT|nr:ABC transporter ATP-binding protein [Pontiella agarivorans]MDZ8119657.1 ABC transporter ATP-binding protein [Pontiella agarivorans]
MNNIIQVRNLSVRLSGTPILEDISFEAAAGEYVSIIGPNGAGKTTLIKCLSGIYSNWTGSISIEGNDSKNLSHRDIARLQSYVPQAEGRMNPLTVEELVATGRYPHLSAFTTMTKGDFSAIDDALERTGIQPFRKRRLNSLSGGERQMAFIAAALAQDTKILLLDEPSTFLDYKHQAEVSSILKSACRDHGRTIIAVHHDINMAAACSNKVIALKAGSIIFSGTAQEATDTTTLKKIYDTNFISAFTSAHPLPLIITGGDT